MLPQFSADQQPLRDGSPGEPCPNCAGWIYALERYMVRVREQAEQDFTHFLGYEPQSIICLNEAVVEQVCRENLSWRILAQAVKAAYLLEWYDREALFPLPAAEGKESRSSQRRKQGTPSYPMTLRTGRQARQYRPKSVLDMDALSEYRSTPGRYRVVLRCLPDAQSCSPLLVEARYDKPTRRGEAWVLCIETVIRPRVEMWNGDYTQLRCRGALDASAERMHAIDCSLFPCHLFSHSQA
jgi:hypothetical protein